MTRTSSAITMKVAEMVVMFPQREIADATIIGYANRLSQFPDALIVAAIDHLIETAKWFPTIADILDTAGVGGNQNPPFVLLTGPTGHPTTVALFRARLQHGQQLRYDRDACPPTPPKDAVEHLIWMRSISRASFPEYQGDLGIRRWNAVVAQLEEDIGVPEVKAIGGGT